MRARSCLMFLTQCARCHCTEAQSSAVTSAQPGNLVQSGSTSSTRVYGYGCSKAVGWALTCSSHPALRRVSPGELLMKEYGRTFGRAKVMPKVLRLDPAITGGFLARQCHARGSA